MTMKKTVTDINGIHYTLGEELGCGGQGKVFRCANDGRRAIKIFDSSNSQIDRVRRYRLNPEMFIIPEIPLKENKGYVMELLEDGMQSLETVFWSPLKDRDFSPEWYAATGGLEKRYRVLAKIADGLHQLHARGLIYRDISLKNIFVSASPEKSAVCFIDCDNIAYDTPDMRQLIATPGFIPPEFYDKKHYGSLSEVFSFAVLAFMILRTQHPFRGTFYRENIPTAFEKEYKNGTLPYIDDHQNMSNNIPGLFAEEKVFSERLQGMFHSIFGENIQNPQGRQTIALWREAFQTLSNRLVKCPNCKNDLVYPKKGCLWCGDKSVTKYLSLNIVVHDGWVEKYIADFYEQIGRTFSSKEEKTQEIKRICAEAATVRKKNRKGAIPFLVGQTRVLDLKEITGLPVNQYIEVEYTGKSLLINNRTDFLLKAHGLQRILSPGRTNSFDLPDKNKRMQWNLILSPEQSVILLFSVQ